ncbi:unnamed protein product [Darwinula stevensoni]|uniref:Large ribosomal subunit protein uL4 C-terminal domain-containing protein n=1 Tax=Darwinula stevensoni TaxID=69355 RepID=A0A7R9AEX5_9CRUS|nr:unnamed protein product [Darwinula stevensoni]CAG0902527.1 unnamed protein product [Darwinula stevensoni]
MFLKKIRAWDDVAKVYNSKRFRAGKGKLRNRRRIHKLGPLVVYDQDQGLRKAFRNIPGVECIDVMKLNLLRLAPGGHVGRFCIWTESAFKKLNDIYGTWTKPSTLKKGYNLPMHKMKTTDLARLINSDEIKAVTRKPRRKMMRHKIKPNPLRNLRVMLKLNPYTAVVKRNAILLEEKRKKEKEDLLAKKRGVREAKLPVEEDKLKKKRLEMKRKARAKAGAPKKAKKTGKKPPTKATGKKPAAKPAVKK